MNADMLRDFIRRQPFVPFTIHMNDGRKFEIQHRDFLLLPPGWSTTAIVCYPDERFEFVYIRNVTSISSEGPIPETAGRRAEGGAA
jgi:hypothetical protein